MTLTDHVSSLETECDALRLQTDSDAKTIALMKQQYDELHQSFSQVQRAHDNEVRELRTERDIAVRKATEVDGILNNAANMIIGGLRKMRGDAYGEANDAEGNPSPVDPHPKLPAPPQFGGQANYRQEHTQDDSELDDGLRRIVSNMPARTPRWSEKNG